MNNPITVSAATANGNMVVQGTDKDSIEVLARVEALLSGRRTTSILIERNVDDGRFDQPGWIAMDCEVGSICSDNIDLALKLAMKTKKTVVFVWNYIDIFMVFPDGGWQARRTIGGCPIYGPHKNWKPQEGWSAFFDH